MAGLAPSYILTGELDPESFAWLDGLRARILPSNAICCRPTSPSSSDSRRRKWGRRRLDLLGSGVAIRIRGRRTAGQEIETWMTAPCSGRFWRARCGSSPAASRKTRLSRQSERRSRPGSPLACGHSRLFISERSGLVTSVVKMILPCSGNWCRHWRDGKSASRACWCPDRRRRPATGPGAPP